MHKTSRDILGIASTVNQASCILGHRMVCCHVLTIEILQVGRRGHVYVADARI